MRLRVLFFRQRAGEEADARAQGGKERLRVLKVLLGEHFRGRHQRRLKAALPGKVHGAEGHGGLAAAHVALQQPRHGRVHAQIARHFIECAFLGVRGREGQKFPKILDVFIGKGQLHARARVRAQQRERHLIEQQFLKGDAPPRGGERFAVEGKMGVVEGEIALAKAVAPPKALGQFVRPLAAAHLQRRAHGFAHGARGHAGNGAVDRLDAAFVLDGRALQLQFAPAQRKTAVEQKLPAGIELFFQPRLVVPDGDGVAAFVGDAGAGDAQARRELLGRFAHHARGHGALKARVGLAKRRGGGEIAVSDGQAHDQIAQRMHARLFKRPHARGAEARQAGKFFHHSTAMR